MNDEQLEDRLRQVRPAGPRPELRASIVAARPAARAWPWAVAAAGLLAVAVALQVSAGQLLDGVRQATAAGVTAEDPLDLAAARDAGMDEADVTAIELSRELARRLGHVEEEPLPR